MNQYKHIMGYNVLDFEWAWVLIQVPAKDEKVS